MQTRKTQKTRKYLVVGFERLRYSMGVEATSKTEARKKFEEYVKAGMCGWISAGTSVRVIEMKQEGGAK